VNIFAFLKNCINGDSVINFEVIHHEEIQHPPLKFLWDLRFSFYNYKIIRSYNGLGRRDIREIPKQVGDYDKNKKIAHALRCLEFSKLVMDRAFSPKVSEELKNRIQQIKKIQDWKERNEISEIVRQDLELSRARITELYSTGKSSFPSFMTLVDQQKLDSKLNQLISSDLWKEKCEWEMNLFPFYDAHENPDIRYE
jgi:hypothetical protein